jgi:hypothetical protein
MGYQVQFPILKIKKKRNKRNKGKENRICSGQKVQRERILGGGVSAEQQTLDMGT